MLNQFQAVWDSDMADCESMVRRRRRIMASLAIEDEEVLDLLERDGSWTDVLDETDANFEDHRANLHRKVQDDENVWDLWHEDVSWQISLFLKAVGADWSRRNAFEVNIDLTFSSLYLCLPFVHNRLSHRTISLDTREVSQNHPVQNSFRGELLTVQPSFPSHSLLK